MLTYTARHAAPSQEEMVLFVTQLEHLVEDEARTQKARLHAQWSDPLTGRLRDGRAISDLTIEQLAPTGTLHLRCPHNCSRFREGDILRLNRGDPFDAQALNVTLEREAGTSLLVSSAERDVNWESFERTRQGWVLDEGLLDLSHYYLEALKQVATFAIGRERILPLLMGAYRPRFNIAAYEEAEAWAAQAGLNAAQTEAMAYAYSAPLAYLIQGPPGTGKTHVLATLVQALVGRGERVLVTSFTHRAINNALNKIVKVAPDLLAVKVGQGYRADDLVADSYERFSESPLIDELGGYVVGATPFATRTNRLEGVQFDTILFDEASQITLPLAIMGMLKGTSEARYIFIGDHRQMPPVLVTRGPDTLIRQSVFAALKGSLEVEDDRSTMLTVTYRLNEALTTWPSQRFYQGKLISAVKTRQLNYPIPPQRHQAILDPGCPKVFVDLEHRDARTESADEVKAVCALIDTLLASGIAPGEIGVVAPFRAQGRAIRTSLREMYPDTIELDQLVVDTVERMQGQERDVVILSLSTSSAAFATALAEFFFQPERLNVAITRPRSKLIIVGSRHVLEAAPPDPDARAGVALLRELLASCITLPWID